MLGKIQPLSNKHWVFALHGSIYSGDMKYKSCLLGYLVGPRSLIQYSANHGGGTIVGSVKIPLYNLTSGSYCSGILSKYYHLKISTASIYVI